MIKKTLYHELGHINDMTVIPKLYEYAFNTKHNRKQIVAQF